MTQNGIDREHHRCHRLSRIPINHATAIPTRRSKSLRRWKDVPATKSSMVESWIAECWVTEDVFELNLTYREHVTDPRWNDESGEEI